MFNKKEDHIGIGRFLKDIIFAANDGVITTFAVIAGISGAGLSSTIILIVGFSSLIADAFSMSTGNYLGTKAEQDFYLKEEKREAKEIEEMPEEEKKEIRIILSKKGYRGDDLEKMIALISSNKKAWIDLMMRDELFLTRPYASPFQNAIITFVSFITVGSIPLLPYVLFNNGQLFIIAIVFSGIALFSIGALRVFFSNRSWFISGIEMLGIGGIAASIAYYIGFFIKMIVV